MNFLQLQYFIEIARHESFSKAAEALGVSQAALSLSHSKLEKELGQTLLEHRKRRVILTPYGEIFLNFCMIVTHEVEDIHSEFQESKGIFDEKEVFLGISDTQYYADWLTDIYDDYPDMRLHILQMSQEQIQDSLINGTLDFGIISGSGIRPTLNRRLLTSQPFELFVLADHPLADRTTISAELLEKQPLISLSPSSQKERMVDILSRELNFHPDIVFEGSQNIMAELFHAGIGGIITCAHDKRQYMQMPPENYASLEILGTNTRYEFYLQWADHRYFTKYNRLFRDYVLDYYHLL
ncbi:MAG: LysR family transcriptional regulator [Peptococcaceae bacterium]|nr:LysR family transcriptional regulator [Peptococcaceae bacterium]